MAFSLKLAKVWEVTTSASEKFQALSTFLHGSWVVN